MHLVLPLDVLGLRLLLYLRLLLRLLLLLKEPLLVELLGTHVHALVVMVVRMKWLVLARQSQRGARTMIRANPTSASMIEGLVSVVTMDAARKTVVAIRCCRSSPVPLRIVKYIKALESEPRPVASIVSVIAPIAVVVVALQVVSFHTRRGSFTTVVAEWWRSRAGHM